MDGSQSGRDQDRDTRHPYAICRRIRLFDGSRLEIGGVGDGDLFLHVPFVVIQIGCGTQRRRQFRNQDGCLFGGRRLIHRAGGRRGCFERFHDGSRFLIVFRCRFIGRGPDAEQVPAVAEHAVIGPIGRPSAHCRDRHKVDDEHDGRKDRQCREAVGHHLVDFIRDRQPAGISFFVTAFQDGRYVNIPFIGDDTLRVIVAFLFGRLDILLNMLQDIRVQLELCENLVVPLENLDGIPALLLGRHGVDRRLFDMGQGVFHRPGEGVHRHRFGRFRGLHGRLGRLHDAGAF